MTLQAVRNAIEGLVTNPSSPNSSSDSTRGGNTNFCFEDAFLSKDLKLTVKDVGEVPFPLTDEFCQKLISVSSKAKFGRGETTVLDTNTRDTQVIPESQLKVEIQDESLKNILERASLGLNISKNCALVPHLYNMLIYGPGQFFKKHRDSEKIPSMVATLVIVLPSVHKGGDLVIEHNKQQRFFFGSQNPAIIKCMMFYSDCLHEIKPVTEGYRVALTFNVVLKSFEPEVLDVDRALDGAINDYFSPQNNNPIKIAIVLDHSYTEANLNWYMLKGRDRTTAFALRAVAKKQNLVPCLAVGSYHTRCAIVDNYGGEEMYEDDTLMTHWVDCDNVKFQEEVQIEETELCPLASVDDLEPYEVEKSGPTGNEGMTVDYWYRQACVVLWANKWTFSHGFKQEMRELHQLTREDDNLLSSFLLEEINNNKRYFFQVNYWKCPEVFKYLIGIVLYVNDNHLAITVLSPLASELLSPTNIEWLIKLENKFDHETWTKVLENWKTQSWAFNKDVPKFVEEYLQHPLKNQRSLIASVLSQRNVDKYLESNMDKSYQSEYDEMYGCSLTPFNPQELCKIIKMCIDLGNQHLVDKLLKHVLDHPKTFSPDTLVEIITFLKGYLTSELFLRYKFLKDAALNEIATMLTQLASTNSLRVWKNLSCKCIDCTGVRNFLHSETSQRHTVKAAMDIRRHVSGNLWGLKNKGYLVLTTEKIGSPHTLVIVKKDDKIIKTHQKHVTHLKKLQKTLELIDFENASTCTALTNRPSSAASAGVSGLSNMSTSRSVDENSTVPVKRQKTQENVMVFEI